MYLPSAEDTDVTKLYHPTKSHDPMPIQSPLVPNDPVGTSHDSELPIMQASCDPTKLASHDSLASHDPSPLASCDHVASAFPGSHDMDTLMASLSVFDATHLGRLGTAVSMETSSMIIMYL